jgi:predicted O-methyltransferase YrrM
MSSEHHVLFAALAKQGSVGNILEIGTFNGINAAFMAHLFPASQITTMDLPNNDSIFTNTYNRQTDSSRLEFIRKRDDLLGQFDNVHFVQKNSLSLTLQPAQGYDLIWVDGAHGYPVLAVDMTNAIRLLNPGGFLLCDDIFFSLKTSDNMYCSVAGYETLSAFCNAGLVTANYIYKRLQKPYGLERFRKHIAVVRQVVRD